MCDKAVRKAVADMLPEDAVAAMVMAAHTFLKTAFPHPLVDSFLSSDEVRTCAAVRWGCICDCPLAYPINR